MYDGAIYGMEYCIRLVDVFGYFWQHMVRRVGGGNDAKGEMEAGGSLAPFEYFISIIFS